MTSITAATECPTIGHLIGGKLYSSTNLSDVIDPGRRSDVVGRVAVGNVEDVDNAVRAAHAAYSSWRRSTLQERASLLLKASEVLANNAEQLVPLLVREHGGVLWEARTDFELGAGVLQHTAGLIEEFFEAVCIDDDKSAIRIEKQPRGVAAAIVPWNMPIVLAMMKLAPAVATGNSIVIKPSPVAPAAPSIALQKIAELFPPGVINVVQGDIEVGEALTTHPLVRKVGFTGGVTTARSVMSGAAAMIKNITLELGGNDPAIVLDDADIDTTLDRMLPGIFTRTGQICFAVKRVYVPRAMHDNFIAALCERLEPFVVGHGLSEGVNFGPLATEAQYRKVIDLIEAAKVSGADVIQTGRLAGDISEDSGYYILPHVVANAQHDSAISSCEQFGPVIPVISYDDEQQAVEWANDSEYGLCSSVWTSNYDRGWTLASQIEAGTTFINTHSFESLDLRMPFGGIKQSGIGREFGLFGMREYVEDHAIRLLK